MCSADRKNSGPISIPTVKGGKKTCRKKTHTFPYVRVIVTQCTSRDTCPTVLSSITALGIMTSDKNFSSINFVILLKNCGHLVPNFEIQYLHTVIKKTLHFLEGQEEKSMKGITFHLSQRYKSQPCLILQKLLIQIRIFDFYSLQQFLIIEIFDPVQTAHYPFLIEIYCKMSTTHLFLVHAGGAYQWRNKNSTCEVHIMWVMQSRSHGPEE